MTTFVVTGGRGGSSFVFGAPAPGRPNGFHVGAFSAEENTRNCSTKRIGRKDHRYHFLVSIVVVFSQSDESLMDRKQLPVLQVELLPMDQPLVVAVVVHVDFGELIDVSIDRIRLRVSFDPFQLKNEKFDHFLIKTNLSSADKPFSLIHF